MTPDRRYQRGQPERSTQPRILIVCEGETEKSYFEAFRHERGLNSLRVLVGGVPRSAVRRALKERESHGPAGEYAMIWVVFDRDQHPNFEDAIESARKSGVSVAWSNPCFELWPILHRSDQTASLTSEQAERQCEELFPQWRKPKGLYHFCLPDERKACSRAKKLRQRHKLNASPESENPSTSVDVLVDFLRRVADEHE